MIRERGRVVLSVTELGQGQKEHMCKVVLFQNIGLSTQRWCYLLDMKLRKESGLFMPPGSFMVEKQGSSSLWGEWGEILQRREGRKMGREEDGLLRVPGART